MKLEKVQAENLAFFEAYAASLDAAAAQHERNALELFTPELRAAAADMGRCARAYAAAYRKTIELLRKTPREFIP